METIYIILSPEQDDELYSIILDNLSPDVGCRTFYKRINEWWRVITGHTPRMVERTQIDKQYKLIF